MSTLQNHKTVGHANGCCRITFFGQKISDGEIGLYSLIIGLAQEGLTYDNENILGRAVETENIFNCRGVLATKQGGNQTVNEKTFSIAYNDDYNFVVNNINPTINRSTMKAILDGSKFQVGAEEIAVLGTQGFRWLGTDDFETLDGTFYAFERDGKLISPNKLDSDGNPTLIANSIKAPYETSALLMVEFLYAFDGSTKKGDRFAYCMPMTSTFTEGSGTSANSCSIDMERFSDARSINEYIVDGAGVTEVPASGDVYYVTADELYYVATVGAPTTTGKAEGTVAVVVDSTDGLLSEVYTFTSSAWVESTTAVFKKSCKFVTKAISTDLAVDPTAGYNLVVAKTDGVSGAFSTYANTISTAGVESGEFYFPIYDWNYGSAVFTNYTGE